MFHYVECNFLPGKPVCLTPHFSSIWSYTPMDLVHILRFHISRTPEIWINRCHEDITRHYQCGIKIVNPNNFICKPRHSVFPYIFSDLPKGPDWVDPAQHRTILLAGSMQTQCWQREKESLRALGKTLRSIILWGQTIQYQMVFCLGPRSCHEMERS